MADASPLYRRLSRSKTEFGGYTSLWLASDHILQLKTSGYVERYHRFYFRDIKGLFTLQTDRRKVVAFVLATLAALVCVILLSVANSYSSLEFLTGLALLIVFSAGALAWNHLLGPGCKVYLATGVQTVQLRALVRRRSTNKIVQEISALVEVAQRELVLEQALPASPPPEPPLTTV